MRVYSSTGIEKLISLGFLSIILTGTLLIYCINLFLGSPLAFIDVLFTVTSAASVTGLVVFDVGKDLVFPSQIILITLIELGGLGIMTVATALPLLLRQHIDLRTRLRLAGGLGIDTPEGAVALLKRVLKFTLVIEGSGCIFLFFGFLFHGEPLSTALYYAIFHSVSAFCNAGFSPYSANIVPFAQSLLVPATLMALIVLGGIGFPIMSELLDYFQRKRRILSAYAKTTLSTTLFLVFFGALLLGASEWNASFSHLPWWGKIWNALFASITPRSAGFEAIPYVTFSSLGAALTILLMVIGASPASTGGGIKTTTLTVMLSAIRSQITDDDQVLLWNRNIGPRTIRKALSLTILYLGILLIGTVLLSLTEKASLSNLFFEAASALGNVGLTRGITSTLSTPGKVIVICLMYWGRVGLITFFYSLIRRERKVIVQYPNENIPVG